MYLVRLKTVLTCLLLLTSTTVSKVAMADPEKIQALNDAMNTLMKVQEEIMALNQNDEVGQHLQASFKQNPEPDEALKLFGEAIDYPADLKREFEMSALKVIDQGRGIVAHHLNNPVDGSCKNQMRSMVPPLEKAYATIRESQALSVGNAEERAKAFTALSSSMGISMISAQISMTAMMHCNAAMKMPSQN